jgi:hypothetical protein
MLQSVSEACVASVSEALFKCFICFRRTLRFNLDVAYVSHICCNNMFQMFQLF